MRLVKFIQSCLLTSLLSSNGYGQKDCKVHIDTAGIISNQNLDRLLDEFETSTVNITNNKKDIPKFIKKALNCLSGNFRLANPGQPFQESDIREKNLPRRQLTFLATNKNLLVMTYAIGGFGLSRRIVIIKFEGKKIIDLWTGYCYGGYDTKEGIIENIRFNRNKEGQLNRKRIFF